MPKIVYRPATARADSATLTEDTIGFEIAILANDTIAPDTADTALPLDTVLGPLTCGAESAAAVAGCVDEAAIAPLERAITLQVDRRGFTGTLARSRFLLARALDDTGSDPSRARTLAEQARDDLASSG